MHHIATLMYGFDVSLRKEILIYITACKQKHNIQLFILKLLYSMLCMLLQRFRDCSLTADTSAMGQKYSVCTSLVNLQIYLWTLELALATSNGE